MNTPLHLERVEVRPGISVPMVFHRGRQYVPVPLLAELMELTAQDLLDAATGEAVFGLMMPIVMTELAVAGIEEPCACVNRCDLPALLGALGDRWNDYAVWLWVAQMNNQLARDAAASELALLALEDKAGGVA